jgi:hypothetical protein
MVELLIAILISLGCYVQSGETLDEIKARDPQSVEKAYQIYDSGNYKTVDGGVVIDESVTD